MPNRIDSRAKQAGIARPSQKLGASRSSTHKRANVKSTKSVDRGNRTASVPNENMSKAQNTALELVDNLTRSGNKVVVAGPGADTRLAGTLVAGGALDNGSSVVRVLNLKESGRFYNTTLVIPPTAPPKNESAPIANSSPGGVATSTTPSNASNVSPVEQGSSPPLPLDKWLALEMTKEIMGWPKN